MSVAIGRDPARDFGAVDHNRPVMADLGAISGVIGVFPTDADVRRLQDEVAFLARERDLWRERAVQAEADADVLATYIAKYARSNVAIRSPIVIGRGTFEAKVTAAYNRARKRMDG